MDYKNYKTCYFITGLSRSGTSIISKIFSSTANSFLLYEPSFLYLLLKRKKLNIELIHDYVLEDLILECVNGRKFNYNKKQSSYILNFKDKNFLKQVYNNINSRKNVKIENYNYFIKIPEIFNEINKLKKKLNFNTTIYIYRDFVEVFNSIKRKKWFEDFQNNDAFISYNVFNKRKYPIYINKKKLSEWDDCDVDQRILEHIKYHFKCFMKLKKKNDHIFINYNKINEAKFDEIFLKLGLKKTNLTKKNINSFFNNRALYKPQFDIKYEIKKQLMKLNNILLNNG